MNLYIRALGFDKLTSEAEEKFIKLEIEDNVANGFVIRHEKLNRGVIIVRISSSTGLYIYGRNNCEIKFRSSKRSYSHPKCCGRC